MATTNHHTSVIETIRNLTELDAILTELADATEAFDQDPTTVYGEADGATELDTILGSLSYRWELSGDSMSKVGKAVTAALDDLGDRIAKARMAR